MAPRARGLLAAAAAASPMSAIRASSMACRSCIRANPRLEVPQKRSLHEGTLRKRADAMRAWNTKASLIKQGEAPHLWDMFKERGFIKDVAGTENQIRELMRIKRIGAYVGIDPTAPSLHVGHLLPLMPLFWMYMHGYRAHTIIGGATAKVGDPTGRLDSRPQISKADLSYNITKIHFQLRKIWGHVEALARQRGYQKEWAWSRGLVNNSEWYTNQSFIEMAQRLFSHIRMGPLMSRDNVKKRLGEGGDGMSLAEFLYPMMQAWDFWHNFSNPRQIQMQIGGSDQYGNIISGIEAIKILRDTEPDPQKRIPDDLLNQPCGFTVPLLTDKAGNKFGKSSGNAVWLDQWQTAPSELYGYFIRRPDDEVERLLKLFTFIPMTEIEEIMVKQRENPAERHAHHALAFEVCALAHGLQEAKLTQKLHREMHAKKGKKVSTEPFERETFPEGETLDPEKAAHFRPDIQLPESLILNKSIARVMFAAGLVNTVTEGNRIAKIKGAYVAAPPGGKDRVRRSLDYGSLSFAPIQNWFPGDVYQYLIDDRYLILRRGKHFIRIIEVLKDDAWAATGKTYRGAPNGGRVRQVREKIREMEKIAGIKFSPAELAELMVQQQLEVERERMKERDPDYQLPTAHDPQVSAKAAIARLPSLLRTGGRKRQQSVINYIQAQKVLRAEELARDRAAERSQEEVEQDRLDDEFMDDMARGVNIDPKEQSAGSENADTQTSADGKSETKPDSTS